MLSSARGVRLIAGAVGVGAVAAAVFVATAPPGSAEPPPNCTAADLAGVMSGVAASTSAYLFTHPDVNDFFTGLKGQPKDQIRTQVQQYMDQHPDVAADLQGIRQPSVDFRNRCGGSP
jgi:hemophore-related protein